RTMRSTSYCTNEPSRPRLSGSGDLFRAARALVTGENPVNGLLRHQLASNHYVFDFRNVADIDQWIGVEQNQIGPFPHFNRALSIFPAQEVSGIDRGRLKGLKWRKPRFGEPLKLVVKTETRNEP